MGYAQTATVGSCFADMSTAYTELSGRYLAFKFDREVGIFSDGLSLFFDVEG